MSDLNKVLLIGRLGSKPEIKKLPTGDSLAKLRVATSYSVARGEGQFEKTTEWHTVAVFGKQADRCADHLDKGSLVYVDGYLHNNSWKDKDGRDHHDREIRAKNVTFLSRVATAGTPNAPQPMAQEAFHGNIGEAVPF